MRKKTLLILAAAVVLLAAGVTVGVFALNSPERFIQDFLTKVYTLDRSELSFRADDTPEEIEAHTQRIMEETEKRYGKYLTDKALEHVYRTSSIPYLRCSLRTIPEDYRIEVNTVRRIQNAEGTPPTYLYRSKLTVTEEDGNQLTLDVDGTITLAREGLGWKVDVWT